MRSVGPSRDDQHMLTDHDRARLEIEGRRWRWSGRKEAAIRDTLDETMTTYALRLHQLIWTDEAMREEPVVVGRLRRLEEARRAARAARAQ